MIDSVYKLAKYLYECGNYSDSIPYLYFCLLVMQPTDKVKWSFSYKFNHKLIK